MQGLGIEEQAERWSSRRLPSQLLGLFSPVVTHDVGPEFDDFRADNCLGRHGESTSEGAARLFGPIPGSRGWKRQRP